MRSIQHIYRTAQNIKTPKYYFSFDDIDKALFLGDPPLYKDYPFKTFKNFNNICVQYRIFVPEKGQNFSFYLDRAIKSINGIEVDGDVTKLNIVLVNSLLSGFNNGLNLWLRYLSDVMEEYAKSSVSLVNWSTVKVISKLFGSNPTYEQRMWISTCSNNDKEDVAKFVEMMRESLLPYLNYNLWSSQKRRKEDFRENADYEKQREEMELGHFNFKEKVTLPEDLDLID